MAFEEYKANVEEFCENKLEELGENNACQFLFSDLKEDVKPFYEHLMWVILNFLDSNDKELFIQIPAEEIGRTETQQCDNFSRLQKLVADCLYIATARQTRRDWLLDLDNLQVGDACFSYENDANYFAQADDRGNGIRPFFTRGTVGCRLTVNEKNRIFSLPVAIKLQNYPGADNANRTRLANRLREAILYLPLFEGITTLDFHKALIVGMPNYTNNYTLPLRVSMGDVDYLSSNVDFESSYPYRSDDYEVVVLAGDVKYNNTQSYLRRNLNMPNNSLKKVIYIGSDLEDEANVCKYSFSYREIFSYFLGNTYPNHIFKPLKFEWLDCRKNEIEEILEGSSLSSFSQKAIMSFLLYGFSDINFQTIDNTPARLDAIRQRVRDEYVDNQLGVEDNIVNSICRWYGNLTFEGVNPKRMYYNGITANGRFQPITRRDSFLRNLQGFINNNNSTRNNIIIDCIGDWNVYVDEIYKKILMKGVMGTYHFLYYDSYTSCQKIINYIEEEPAVYNSEYRRGVLGGIQYQTEQQNQVPQVHDLSELFTDETENIYLRQWQSLPAYSVTFKDGDECDLYGDVLVGEKRVDISELEGNGVGSRITYYKKPDNFNELMRYYNNFPQDCDVEYFSNLWKNRLRQLHNQLNWNNEERLAREIGMSVPSLRIYLNPARESGMFAMQIDNICRLLMRNNMLTEGEWEYIRAARRSVGENSANGRQLKDELFSYMLDAEEVDNCALMNAIVQNSDGIITVDDIVSSSIRTGVIRRIVLNEQTA